MKGIQEKMREKSERFFLLFEICHFVCFMVKMATFEVLLFSALVTVSSQQLTSTTTSSSIYYDVVEDKTVNVSVSTPAVSRNLYEHESKLLKTLHHRYVREARPAQNSTSSVLVSIDMMIIKINQIVERDQEIVISAYLKIGWKDDRLVWDPAQYGGIEWVVLPSSHLWIPDVGIINSPDMYSITRDLRFPAVVDNSGNVIWVPAGRFQARCQFDITYFPFDNQTCFYRIESWTYPVEFLNITGDSLAVSAAHYVPDPQWNVTSLHIKNYAVSYDGGGYRFARIDFILKLHRKPLFFVTYTILPPFVLSILQASSHLMPITDPARISFATTNLIAFSVVHGCVSEHLPKSSDAIPLIAIYLDVLMLLIGMSLIEAFLVANWLERTAGSCPPKWLWVLVVDIFGRLVCMQVGIFRVRYVQLRGLIDDTSAGRRKRAQNVKRKQNVVAAIQKAPPRYPRSPHSPTGDGRNKSKSPAPRKRDWSPNPRNSPELNKASYMPFSTTMNFANTPHPQQREKSPARQQRKEMEPFERAIFLALLQSLDRVQGDVTHLRSVYDDLSARQLRVSSRDVWAMLLNVIDRYIFLFGVATAILSPFYLFLIYPKDNAENP